MTGFVHRVLASVRRAGVVLAAGVLIPALSGCANQQEYDRLLAANRALEERNVLLQQELDSKDGALGAMRGRVGQGDMTLSELQRRNAELNAELQSLKGSYGDLTGRLDRASLGVLDPAIDRALRELAAKHPNMIKYDPARGMVQFASDLTFAMGSVEVTAEARNSLQEFARILASAPGAQYDIRIVGHTDNVPVSRPETRQKHPTNTHLSAHRAISVRDTLATMGVPGNKMEIAGWGEYRPVVANPSKGGASQNRRVEIYLVPSTGGSVDSAAPAPAAAAEPARPEQPMK